MSKLTVYLKQFEYYKSLADKAVAQIKDDDLFAQPNNVSNSISVIVKHIAGNMLSRWTDIFESDGEKSWRDRDDEFIDTFSTRKDLLDYWETGWSRLFETLEDLSDDDLENIIYIRNMGCTVHDAIIRQICHYPYHVGQIVYLARLYKGDDFESLSVPKGESKEYNAKRFSKEKTIKHFTDDLE